MKSKQKIKIFSKTKSIIPINRYDFNNDYYINDDDSVMDLFKIRCRDLTTTNAADVEMDMMNLTNFFRKYADDLKIISINIPTNCQKQINYLNHKIDACKNEYCKKQLIKKREEAIWVEKNRLDKEFYIMIFAANKDKYRALYESIMATLGSNDLLIKINKNQKDEVLMKMNNKNVKK